MWQMRQLIFEWAVTIIIRMNDLRLLLQADKDRKIINLEFKYQWSHAGKSATCRS